MKPFKGLALILALVLLAAPMLVVRPVHAANPSFFSVEPIAVLPLTNLNGSAYGLEIGALPSKVGDFFHMDIYLNQGLNVQGVEVHVNFTGLSPYATLVNFTDFFTPNSGNVLNSPVLEGLTGGIYDAIGNLQPGPVFTYPASYEVAAASSGAPKAAVLHGLIAIVWFQITAQPVGLTNIPIPVDFSSIVEDPSVTPATDIGANVYFDATPFVYPPRPYIFAGSKDDTSGALGDLFNETVSINAAAYWDIAGFDVQLTYDPTLLTVMNVYNGSFLGSNVFGFVDTSIPGIVHVVTTKLADPTPSSGTGTLFLVEFQVIQISTSLPQFSCVFGLTGPTDLAAWAHPERPEAPWFNSILAIDIAFDNSVSPPAWTHYTVNGNYLAPLQIPGAQIDLFSQYPAPFGGQGGNQHSDSFAPQDQVCLYAKVTFGNDTIQNKLVVFQVNDAMGNKLTILQGYTNASGIAGPLCFRIPMTSNFNDTSIFGWWNVIASVSVDQLTFNDTMYFQVGWLAQVTNIVVNNAPYYKYGAVMNFTATVTTIHEQPVSVWVSIDSYDVSGYPIGETLFHVTINATRASCPYIGAGTTTGGVYVYPNLIQPIPSWTRVGPTETVIGYTLSQLPSLGGTALGPPYPQSGFVYFNIHA